MKRIKDTYLETIQSLIPLEGKTILEIGCGDGSRTIQIAECCDRMIAIEPNSTLIEDAKAKHPLINGEYFIASAEALPVNDQEMDIVIFTLSFHHVPVEKMNKAIDETIRVVKPNGHIIFFEPAFTGTFFEAEIRFNACDGDERREKAMAYATILSHKGLKEVNEQMDETVFSFESADDFILTLHPKQGSKEDIEEFLKGETYLLRAERRINIFTPATTF